MERKLIAEADSKELYNEKARIDFKTYKKDRADLNRGSRNQYRCSAIDTLGKVLGVATTYLNFDTKEAINDKIVELVNSIEI